MYAVVFFNDGKFGFVITADEKDLANFSGSKYIKSDAIGIYSKVFTLLQRGEKSSIYWITVSGSWDGELC